MITCAALLCPREGTPTFVSTGASSRTRMVRPLPVVSCPAQVLLPILPSCPHLRPNSGGFEYILPRGAALNAMPADDDVSVWAAVRAPTASPASLTAPSETQQLRGSAPFGCAETCCAGHTHAASHASGKVTMCQGGGTRTLVLTGNTAAARVDHADNGGWRGPTLEGRLLHYPHLPWLSRPLEGLLLHLDNAV